ncbi:Flagellin [Anaerobiospirillum thomasii]|uniref:flagellin n=1 Tax=Anaerobiospirillum thomasii TaxID=179995 RepID=UPI000D9EE6FC|nr:Flagellin [Anaerobiospirillum thomasii]
MDEMTTMLQRIRTLAVQSSNGTNNAKDREALQQEVAQLSSEITRIACATKFGGEQILAGAGAAAGGAGGGTGNGLIDKDGNIVIQVGAYNGDTLKMTGFSLGFVLSKIASTALGAAAKLDDHGFDKGAFVISMQSLASKAIDSVDKFISLIDTKRAHLGAMQNRMESSIRNQSNVSMNVSDARARIRDTDFAEESAKLSQQTIIQQAASSMLTQANSRPQLALSLLG